MSRNFWRWPHSRETAAGGWTFLLCALVMDRGFFIFAGIGWLVYSIVRFTREADHDRR